MPAEVLEQYKALYLKDKDKLTGPTASVYKDGQWQINYSYKYTRDYEGETRYYRVDGKDIVKVKLMASGDERIVFESLDRLESTVSISKDEY